MRIIIRFLLASVFLVIGVLAFLYFVQEWALFEESVSEVKARYAPVFADKREQLKRLVGKLPPPGEMAETKGPIVLDPPLGMDPKTRRRVNFTGAMDFECLNPDDTSHMLAYDSAKFRMVISGGETLVSIVRDMREREGDPYARKRGVRWAKRCEDILNIPYFVICRQVLYRKPVILAEQKTFLPGEVDMEAFVFDLRNDMLKACVRVKAVNRVDKVNVRLDSVKSDGVQGLVGELRDLVHKEAEQKLLALTR